MAHVVSAIGDTPILVVGRLCESLRWRSGPVRARRADRPRDHVVHDWGWLPWDFQEFVLIDDGTLTLAVAAAD